MPENSVNSLLYDVACCGDVECIDGNITNIRHMEVLERSHTVAHSVGSQHAALGPDLPWSVPGTGPVRRSDVHRHPDKAGIQPLRGILGRKPHHCGRSTEPGHFVAAQWLVKPVFRVLRHFKSSTIARIGAAAARRPFMSRSGFLVPPCNLPLGHGEDFRTNSPSAPHITPSRNRRELGNGHPSRDHPSIQRTRWRLAELPAVNPSEPIFWCKPRFGCQATRTTPLHASQGRSERCISDQVDDSRPGDECRTGTANPSTPRLADHRRPVATARPIECRLSRPQPLSLSSPLQDGRGTWPNRGCR